MYIHIGQATLVKTKEIVGIFDLDNTTVSHKTREFLAKAEEADRVVTVGYELPKSFLLCAPQKGRGTKIYLSQLSSSTLQGRLQGNLGLSNSIIERKEDTKL